MSGGGYTRTARVLHWTIAALVFCLLAAGTAMVRVGFDLTTTVVLYQAHKSFGLVVLVLMLMRLAWRVRHVPSRSLAEAACWRNRVATQVHWLLYAVLLALPVTGWFSASAAPIPFPFFLFGFVEVPHLQSVANLPDDVRSVMFERLSLVHRVLAWVLLALVSVHVVGASWPARHRRMVLERMWPRSAR